MRIITKRLELREYTADDLPALVAYQSDARVRAFYGPEESSPAHFSALLRSFLDWAGEDPRRNWQLAIVLREDPSRVLGSCGLRRAGLESGKAELGIDLAPHLWGGGYATEAAEAMLDFGFASLELGSIRARTISGNERATDLVRRLGFRSLGARDGPAWMSERGWTHTEWELASADWRRRSSPGDCTATAKHEE